MWAIGLITQQCRHMAEKVLKTAGGLATQCTLLKAPRQIHVPDQHSTPKFSSATSVL